MSDELKHYGIPRKSGRYPWGSGENPYQSEASFLGYISEMKDKGMSEVEIAKSMGMKTTELRAKRTIAVAEERRAKVRQANKLKDKGYSNVAIGKRMGINESTVRSLLDPVRQERAEQVFTTANMLKDELKDKKYLDVGVGVENHLGISRVKLLNSVAILKEQGYEVHKVQVDQMGVPGNKTTIMVLAPEGTTAHDIYKNIDDIGVIGHYSEDGGRSYLGLKDPTNVKSDRIEVAYAEDGGDKKDGLIEIRPGVDDISLGGSRYAQVRIGVDGTHYLKGMAVYNDKLPKGVDIRFNTNKSKKDTTKMGAMKDMKEDSDNPFGATVRQRYYKDKNGKDRLSAINIVNEEGDWSKWSNNIASQMLSKQRPSLAKKQLNLAKASREEEYEEIKSLTNPTIKRRLLEAFADGAEAAAVHLKAAALPRQRTQVLLPVNELKDNEIYAPNFRNGETVALVRYPHGGIFEIPELKVNNRNRAAKKILGNAEDAVAINAKVANRLSGADFDGDTVLVIPNNSGAIKTSQALKGLADFDPQEAYPGHKGMPKMKPKTKQQLMGDVSNLITDMTIKGASQSEIARAVRHSMVVIDAEKHHLNYKQSHIDNGIAQLKTKYQGGPRKGASTLISRASGQKRVPTGETYINKQGKEVAVTRKSKQMAETDDAYTLSSGTLMENIYADYANSMKALANEARKEAKRTGNLKYSPAAKKTYAREVNSLDAKLNVALKNKPIERQAQIAANVVTKAKIKENPDMDADDRKRLRGQAIAEARKRTGANKQRVKITPKEWEAIQAGAISDTKLRNILDNTDLDVIKEYAMPRTKQAMTPAKVARAKAMLDSGYTQADVADALGLSVTTVMDALN